MDSARDPAMPANWVRRDYLVIGGFVVAYFLAHRLSFLFPDAKSIVMSVWPASGIALAGLLLLPRRHWPFLLLGIFLAGVTDDVLFSGRRLTASLGFMISNLLEAGLCGAVICELAKREVAFDRVREVAALFAAVLGVNALTACVGALAALYATGELFGHAWRLWYVADGIGLLLVAPLIVTWARIFQRPERWNARRGVEATGFALLFGVIAWAVFTSTNEASHLSLGPYLLIALLAWPAFRYGQHIVATLLFGTAVLAIIHLGWFDPTTPDGTFDADRLWVTQVFLTFAALSGYVMGAIYAEMQASAIAMRRNEARYRAIARVVQYHPESTRDFLDYALAEAVTLTDSVFGYIYHYDEATQRFVLNSWSGQVMQSCGIADRTTEYDLATTGIWGEAVRQRRPILLNDFEAAHPLKKGYPDGHAPLSRFLTIPIFVNERIVAVIGVANKVAAYDVYDIEQLQVFADATWKVVEQRRATLAQAESDARHAAVFYRTPVAMSVTRLSDGRIVDLNAAAVRLLGHSRETSLASSSLDLGVWAEPEQRAEMAHRMSATGHIERMPVTLRTRTGERLLIELSGELVECRGEACMVATMMDVTERTRLAELHLQTQKLESLGTMAGGIAHDFNNILGAVRGFTDLAMMDVPENGEAHESLIEIRRAGDRAGELVRRMLAFARPTEPQRAVVDLSTVVREVLSLLRSAVPATITFRTVFTSDCPSVFADSGQVHEALVNLTTNAAYAIGHGAGVIEYRLESVQLTSAEAGRITASLAAGRYARLTVTDTGCGMDAATLARVFDAFFTTKPVSEGTGLGLSMVHGTMMGHSGAVTVESAVGQGTTFHLYFPAAEAATERPMVSATVTEEPAAARAPRLHVLYIDDEEPLVHLANRMLTRDGHRVSGFTAASEALAAFHANPAEYDVVVTDLSMPQMSGFDIARAVLAVRPAMPIVLTTGFAREEDERTAREIGIREVIRKPLSLSTLGVELTRLARSAPTDPLVVM